MNLIERIKKICLTPKTEWGVIATEPTQKTDLITGYVLPLAAVGAVAGFIGGSLIGYSLPLVGRYRVPFVAGLSTLILTLVLSVVAVFVLSLIINALAPTFGARKDDSLAFKVAVYSYTPAWVAGVFQLLPGLSILVLLGGLYGIYLMYLGLPRLMQAPEDKATGYTAVVVVCAFVLSIVTATIGGLFVGGPGLGSAALGGGGAESNTEFDTSTPLGRLAAGVEESARRMEEAEKTGDPNAQAAAALGTLGALLGGGRRVEPLAVEEIRSFVPETFAGLPRTNNSAERTGVVGITVSRADASYGDGNARVTLEIVDSGGATGLMGLASWANVQGERESDSEIERTRRVGNRLVHEKISKVGQDHEFALVLGDRFLVTARGRGLEANALQDAVSSLDLGRLESLKDAGVQP